MSTNQPLPTKSHRTILALGCTIALLATLLLLMQANTLPSRAASDPFASPIRPGATPTTPGAAKMFDFSKDLDHNGYPDEFEEATKHYLAVMRDHPNDKALLEAERKAKFDRIPYSGKSRAIFAQLEHLGKKLLKTKDDAEARAILDQIDTLQQQLEEDPVYQITTRYAEMRLRQAMDERMRSGFASATAEAAQTPANQEPTPAPTATPSAVNAAGSEVHNSDADSIIIGQNRLFLPLLAAAGGSKNDEADTNNIQAAAVTANKYVFMPLVSHQTHYVDFTKLQRGDLLFRNGKTQGLTLTYYVMIFSHVGFFDGSLKTYEANLVNEGNTSGVRLLNLSTWQKPFWVGLMRAKGTNANGVSLTPTVVQGALDWAEGEYGTCTSAHPKCTPYNWWILDKN